MQRIQAEYILLETAPCSDPQAKYTIYFLLRVSHMALRVRVHLYVGESVDGSASEDDAAEPIFMLQKQVVLRRKILPRSRRFTGGI
jgi:hypothetical protein